MKTDLIESLEKLNEVEIKSCNGGRGTTMEESPLYPPEIVFPKQEPEPKPKGCL